MHIVVHEVTRRNPRTKVILSHAGGFLPYTASLFTGAAAFSEDLTPDGMLGRLQALLLRYSAVNLVHDVG